MLKVLPKRFSEVAAIKEGRVYLVCSDGYWGKGTTLLKALNRCAREGFFKPKVDRVLIYDVHADSTVDSGGRIVTPLGVNIMGPQLMAKLIEPKRKPKKKKHDGCKAIEDMFRGVFR